MAQKQFLLPDGPPITIYKRKGNRNLRLSLSTNGEVRVTIPAWAPYSAGLEFAKSREAWIKTQYRPTTLLMDGQAIGKAHHLRFIPSAAATRVSSRLKGGEILITHPQHIISSASQVQKIARVAGIRALRTQAAHLLSQRLSVLAKNHNFAYRSVNIKQLKGRWGSCDQYQNIILNLFLMQLPWECIDYVLLHELVHTQVMKHGPDFWQSMDAVLPDAK